MAATTDSATHEANVHPTTISRIAVGVDGFPEGNDAAVLGATLARALHAELMLVAVHPDPLVVMPEEMNWKSLENQAADMLREARDAFAPHARTVVETDPSIPSALERVVRREHRDLLVVGSSRHGPEGRVRIGKRTRQLLCHFRCALGVAPRGIRKRADQRIRRIAVGYDGGPESDAALAVAGSIALAAGADLQVCGVVDDRVPPIGWSPLGTGGAAVPRWEEAVLAEVASLRELALTAIRLIGTKAEAEVLRGRPADALLRLSSEADLLVIGSRRWGAVARLLLGSTGEALAHEAACPLLVVPRPGRSGSGP
jgi:nucleotide-binding universal stress UspA family protein